MNFLVEIFEALQINVNVNDLQLFFSEIHVGTIGYLSGGIFFILLVLGLTGKITIYKNLSDAIWSFAQVGIPVCTLIALFLLVPPEPKPEEYSFFWENANHQIISVTAGSLTALSILMSVGFCLKNNGLALGPIMFIFKLVIATLFFVLVAIILINLGSNKKAEAKG